MTASKKLKYSLSVKKLRVEYAKRFKRQVCGRSFGFPRKLKNLAVVKKSEQKKSYKADTLKKARLTAGKAYAKKVNILINLLVVRAVLMMRNRKQSLHKRAKQPSRDSKEDAPHGGSSTAHLLCFVTNLIFDIFFKNRNFINRIIASSQIKHKSSALK